MLILAPPQPHIHDQLKQRNGKVPHLQTTLLTYLHITSWCKTFLVACQEAVGGWLLPVEDCVRGQGWSSGWPTHATTGTCPESHIPGPHNSHRPTSVQGRWLMLRYWCRRPRAWKRQQMRNVIRNGYRDNMTGMTGWLYEVIHLNIREGYVQ